MYNIAKWHPLIKRLQHFELLPIKSVSKIQELKNKLWIDFKNYLFRRISECFDSFSSSRNIHSISCLWIFDFKIWFFYETIIYSIFRILNFICQSSTNETLISCFFAALSFHPFKNVEKKKKKKKKKECSPIFRKARPIHLFLIFQFSSKLYLGLLGNDRQYNEHKRKFVE
jgi:hypothetical protein